MTAYHQAAQSPLRAKTMYLKKLPITILVIILSVAVIGSCDRKTRGFSQAELALIHGSDSIMRVLTIEDVSDSIILRKISSELPDEALLSSDYDRLTNLMVATVKDPSQGGVGIAGPQVGINRRIIAVQRFDKDPIHSNGMPDYPFEVYPNAHIIWASDSLVSGPEGCLSVPDRKSEVLRSHKIVIEYAVVGKTEAGYVKDHGNISGSAGNKREEKDNIRTISMVRDTISGFTAVIFQHEIDHLDGILYTDRI